jgi:hypothetical protein
LQEGEEQKQKYSTSQGGPRGILLLLFVVPGSAATAIVYLVVDFLFLGRRRLGPRGAYDTIERDLIDR